MVLNLSFVRKKAYNPLILLRILGTEIDHTWHEYICAQNCCQNMGFHTRFRINSEFH